jgi:hypothetical protein
VTGAAESVAAGVGSAMGSTFITSSAKDCAIWVLRKRAVSVIMMLAGVANEKDFLPMVGG